MHSEMVSTKTKAKGTLYLFYKGIHSTLQGQMRGLVLSCYDWARHNHNTPGNKLTLGARYVFWEDGGRKPERLVGTHPNRENMQTTLSLPAKTETQDLLVVKPLDHHSNTFFCRVKSLHLQTLANQTNPSISSIHIIFFFGYIFNFTMHFFSQWNDSLHLHLTCFYS